MLTSTTIFPCGTLHANIKSIYTLTSILKYPYISVRSGNSQDSGTVVTPTLTCPLVRIFRTDLLLNSPLEGRTVEGTQRKLWLWRCLVEVFR